MSIKVSQGEYFFSSQMSSESINCYEKYWEQVWKSSYKKISFAEIRKGTIFSGDRFLRAVRQDGQWSNKLHAEYG